MSDKLFEQLQRCHNDDEHDKIVEAILNIPLEQRNYELIGLLARAYNNLEEYNEAIEQLLKVKNQGKKDALWLFRLGYAYFYLEDFKQALTIFEKCKEINPDEQDIDLFINMTNASLFNDFQEFNDIESKTNQTSEDYTSIISNEDGVSVCFYIDHDKVLSIGEKINEINEEAYMNGYNWEAFFTYYLPKYAPDIDVGMDVDPEAGMYVAYYDFTLENKERAEKLVEIIHHLIENEEELYAIIRNEGENIAWD